MKKDKPYDRTVFQSMTMILQFGINMIVPMAMMTALGIWLDRKFDTAYLTILFFFIGALAGGQNIYRMAKQIYKTPDDRRSSQPGSGRSDSPGGSQPGCGLSNLPGCGQSNLPGNRQSRKDDRDNV